MPSLTPDPTRLAGVDDVIAAVETDPRLAGWSVLRRREAALELEGGQERVDLLWPEAWSDRGRLAPHGRRAAEGECGVVLLGGDGDLAGAQADWLGSVPDVAVAALPISPLRLALTLARQAEAVRLKREAAVQSSLHARARYENELLISIGRALSQERDIDALLELILTRARDVTGADAGSVYIVSAADGDEEQTVRFAASQNDSVAMEVEGFTMPVTPTSIVGACVLSGEAIDIPDLYRLDPPRQGNNPWGFVHNRSFDQKLGYQTRSMVTVPMISARTQVIGVIQLINKRTEDAGTLGEPADFDTKVVPFDQASIDISTTLASQAGIALENALLYDEVQRLFEGFVRASVTAIESRDPTTSGHSARVADLTLGLARAVNATKIGRFAEVSFSDVELKEIEYAAVLHDFGKVGVREHVLVKPRKLLDSQRLVVQARFDYIRKESEAAAAAEKVDAVLAAGSRQEVLERIVSVDAELAGRLARIDDCLRTVLEADEPRPLADETARALEEVAARRYRGPDGREHPYITDEELAALKVPRGSLTEEERVEIESHVVHTHNFLSRIPWGKAYGRVPDIAGRHHEKLDGTGYPDRATAEDISLASRMMAIADIYDALTAADRPYKKAMPHERAMQIVGFEVKAGHLDLDLFKLFEQARIFEIVQQRAYTGPIFSTQLDV